MKLLELAGVIAVGTALGWMGSKAKVGAVISGALLYTLGVFIGTKRPASGWLGAKVRGYLS